MSMVSVAFFDRLSYSNTTSSGTVKRGGRGKHRSKASISMESMPQRKEYLIAEQYVCGCSAEKSHLQYTI